MNLTEIEVYVKFRAEFQDSGQRKNDVRNHQVRRQAVPGPGRRYS